MSFSGIVYRRNSPSGTGGKLFATVFGLVFAGVGLLLCWAILRGAVAGLQTWTWRETPCAITAAAVVQQNPGRRNGGDFAFEVKYRYTVDGTERASQQYKMAPGTSEDYRDMALLAERFPIGAKTLCYVNPKAPNEAVLIRYNLLTPLVIFLPLAFVGFGVLIVYLVWKSPAPARSAISSRAAPASGTTGGIISLSVFLFIGGIGLYLTAIRPLSKSLVARSWPGVPCVVLSSSVKGHSGSKGGTTYSVNIFYSYDFNGSPHKSNAYDFMGGSSSGYSGKQAVVSQYPPGTKSVCYVNPNDPTEAVLARGLSSVMWFGLIPLVFVAIGGGGLVAMLRKNRGAVAVSSVAAASNTAAAWNATPSSRGAGNLATEMLVLKPAASPWVRLIGAIFLCLFWNGIISLFLHEVYSGWKSGRPDWFLTVFMIPFVVIGLVLLGAVFYCFLALFDPRPHLTIQPGAVASGDSLHVKWMLTGNVSRLQNLRLLLSGREEARVGRGRGSHTDTSYFASVEIANVTLPREMQNGEARVTVPAHLVPSFQAPNNKIIWTIYVRGEIPRWPDLKQDFPITVLPGQPGATQSI